MRIYMLLIIGLLSSCSTITQKESETVDKTGNINSKEPRQFSVKVTQKENETVDKTENINSKEPRQFSVKARIAEGKNVLSASQLIVTEGKEGTMEVAEERFLPVKWLSPDMDNGNKVAAAPVFDNSTNFGISLKTMASKVRLNKHQNTIHIQGKILHNQSPEMKVTKFQDDALFKENLISYSKYVCHYSLFIKDGASRKIKFKFGEKEYIVEFTVNEIDPSNRDKPSSKSEPRL